MNLQPRIETFPQKKFIGKRIKMSLAGNKTLQLWQSFMPEKSKVKDVTGTELYSIENYTPDYFKIFNPAATYEKWAAVEVCNLENVPEGMEAFTSPEGVYAIFLYKGSAGEAPETYQYIFNEWLPQSGYVLDDRPHFAVMGEKYKNNDPDSEEELYIPIKPKC
ncbi:GyrI-like domain-containing protein [Zhouia spongiae]|uniref:GyrI-like domain-containing protein n=1 Tax=Zhouia spongiae TaxID=2202721 RepID=A0ABY3YPI6_9FLAO|nr:GyrI-like domain-containing protein [Zhouia spongiae]UNY99553.1 GyrI-like domain-containing protein [Zhouia spongiae]